MAMTAPDLGRIPQWTLGERMRKARLSAVNGEEMLVTEIAELLGRKPNAIYSWENDYRNPSLKMLNRWAEITGVDIIWLLHGIDRGRSGGSFNVSLLTQGLLPGETVIDLTQEREEVAA